MERVFVLQHVHDLGEDKEDVKFIGVYRSHAAATMAVRRLSQAPGFKDTLDGFHIDTYELDKDHWVEGYGLESEE